MKKLLFLLTLLTLPVFGQTLKVNPKRTISLEGTVSIAHIGDVAQTIHEYSQQSKKTIFLLINSPGGNVLAGLPILDAIKMAQSRGVAVVCVSSLMSASMAFTIYSACTRRYATKNTLFLFHPMSTSGQSGIVSDLVVSMAKMQELEARLAEDSRKVLKMSKSEFYKHYRAETLWTAENLKKSSPDFLRIVSNIEGVKTLYNLEGF